MHGIIFIELKKYVSTKHSNEVWETLLKEAGIDTVYMPTKEYPDEEALAIVSTASKMTGASVPVILEDFGEFITPDLVNMYKVLIKPDWKTLDMLEKTEETIHRIVRLKNPGARPPELRCTRVGPDEVEIKYSSARKMCGIAKGIVKGLAKHYGERVMVLETTCMHKGDPECTITVKIPS